MATLWMYTLEPTRPEMITVGVTEQEDRVMRQHIAYLRELASDGRLLFAGRAQVRSADKRGLALVRAADEDEARHLMESDPAVQAGLMKAALLPYRLTAGSAEALRQALERE